MTTRIIRTDDEAQALARMIAARGKYPVTVSIKKGLLRTEKQNALIHRWFGEIAAQLEDRSAAQVKGMCHVEFGLVIRLRDEVFNWVWQRSGAMLPREKQEALLSVGNPVFAMSSAMNVKELTEYMDAMQPFWISQGYRLTHPNDMKYQEEMR